MSTDFRTLSDGTLQGLPERNCWWVRSVDDVVFIRTNFDLSTNELWMKPKAARQMARQLRKAARLSARRKL